MNNSKPYLTHTLKLFMCFVCISEQTAIISLYNINWLVCITETECVYCAVRTEPYALLRFYTRFGSLTAARTTETVMATYGSVDRSSISDRGKDCSLTTCQVLTTGAAAFWPEANRAELEANN